MKISSPIKWYGGKARLAKKIVECMPQHHCYVELCGGAGSVLFSKSPAKFEVYNDIHGDVVNLMRVVRDPVLSRQLADQIRLTPYARDEHAYCRDHARYAADEVERARALVVRVRQSRNGIVDGSWRTSRDGSDVSPFVNCADLIAPACERLRGVRIENSDFARVINTWDGPETLMYADPPYVHDTRVADLCYEHEMSIDDHERLLQNLCDAKGMAILSGYASELYDDRLGEWHRIEIPTRCWATPIDSDGRKQRGERIEILWLNPAATERLKCDVLPTVTKSRK